MANYADLFVEKNENNIESLFEIQYSSENGNTNGQANTLGGWHISNVESGGGGHVVIPTDYYSNSFEAGDARKDASIRYKFYDANGNEVDYWWWADVTKPHVKKYDITKGESVNGGLSSRNLYYLRYADAILMYAETLNELNEPANALTYLNKIRTRAKLANWETVLGHTPTQQELRDELLTERMRELGFEGWRWCDLKRTGKLITSTKTNNPDATQFISDKNLLFPIPAREFELNRALKPSDQNPGFNKNRERVGHPLRVSSPSQQTKGEPPWEGDPPSQQTKGEPPWEGDPPRSKQRVSHLGKVTHPRSRTKGEPPWEGDPPAQQTKGEPPWEGDPPAQTKGEPPWEGDPPSQVNKGEPPWEGGPTPPINNHAYTKTHLIAFAIAASAGIGRRTAKTGNGR